MIRNATEHQVFEGTKPEIRFHSGHEIITQHLLHCRKQEVEISVALL